MKLKWILLGIVPVGLMGCSAAKHVASVHGGVELRHVDAGGHKLILMSPDIDTQVRFISHKQHDFMGAPSIDDTTVVLNVAAAFTKDISSMDVCGDHVVAGERIKGYDDVTATGHLLIINNKVEIRSNDFLEKSIAEAVDSKGYLFQQCLIVEDGRGVVERIPQAIRDRKAHIIYRAACVMNDGSFAIVQGGEPMFCGEFIDALVAMGARQALYLDMGTWAWGWVRSNCDSTQELSEHFYNTRFQSNWFIITYP